ncbi:hypothetical protein [Thermomonospora umbrina]|uniref:Uncharacterized protein n=1 Tax=Thermomonospora umbrina TaxID=111806 RepID=A0A3D9SL38_9ACTN|nr:hypothetical protein [Thermomonospora umbrina]REE96646.1 hypothetical protein DFJ69_2086 [Thermomonospora umbrina]
MTDFGNEYDALWLARDTSRAGQIAGLRELADLLEVHPDIPVYDHGSISFALGSSETEAFEVIDRAAAALTAAGVPFQRRDTGNGRGIKFVVGGIEYGFSRMYDAQYAAHQARQSYETNVQVAADDSVAGSGAADRGEVGDSSVPPGGYVYAGPAAENEPGVDVGSRHVCGMPVESEPCPHHSRTSTLVHQADGLLNGGESR